MNTAPIAPEVYAEHYSAWGGSFILHPEVLQFFEERFGLRTAYRGYFKDGRCVGAIAAWGPYIAGDYQALHACRVTDQLDFGYPILYLPIAPGHRCSVLYRAGYLLNDQRTQIARAAFPGVWSMSILKQIPDGLPSSKHRLQVEQRRFERRGGTVRDIKEFGSGEVAAMYEELFSLRWKRRPLAADTLKATLDRLGRFLFGKVLWLKDRPVAIQLNYRAETRRTICIDYVNGGIDKSLRGISTGSLLSYLNGSTACAEARAGGKQLIYSYGRSGAAYKDQWCERIPRGFTGFWLP